LLVSQIAPTQCCLLQKGSLESKLDSSVKNRQHGLAKIMFGQGKRPRRPYGHYIPNGKKWQGLLDARLVIPKRTKPEANQAHQQRGRAVRLIATPRRPCRIALATQST
jgi:hypothetical protein